MNFAFKKNFLPINLIIKRLWGSNGDGSGGGGGSGGSGGGWSGGGEGGRGEIRMMRRGFLIIKY